MMGERIVFQPFDQPVAILIPCECGLSASEIGKKDVPFGLPFWIVEESTIPSDRSMRDAWIIDESKLGPPHGNGGTYKPGA